MTNMRSTSTPIGYRMGSLSFALLLTGINFCTAANAQTTLNQPWSDQAFIAANSPFRSVLVIAVTNEAENRPKLEDGFVNEIGKTKADAVSSTSIMPAETEFTEETVKAAVAASGRKFDVVLLSYLYRVDDVDIVNVTDPGTKRSERDFALGLWGNWENARDFVLDAGVTTRRQYILEHSVYYLESAKQIWTIQSRSMDPKSAEEIVQPVSKLITEALVKDNLL